jgi:hypothetical protein
VLSLNAAPLADAVQWMEHYRRFWDGRLAALEEFVTRQAQQKRSRK